MVSARRIVLCGTNYGASYLPALQGGPFELAGIFARGSERSVQLAARSKVPLWSRIEDIPHDIDSAIIALSQPAADTVAEELIGRGVHLLVEHPVDTQVLRAVRARADRANVVHHVNCHFGELAAARAFVSECRRRASTEPIRFALVITAPRGAYSTFDLLGRALGGLSQANLQIEATAPVGQPFVSFHGKVGEVFVRVQCSRDTGDVDDGSSNPIPQRIEIGFDSGTLMMFSPIGPILGAERLRLALRDFAGPLWVNHTPASMTFPELLGDRVNANRRALDELHERRAGGSMPPHQATEWLATVGDLMSQVRA